MTKTVTFLAASAVLCLVLFGLLMLFGVQLLSKADAMKADVVYGEGEDFFADAFVFRKPRNDTFLLVLLPHARPSYRWVSIDFGDRTITFPRPPRMLGSLMYRLKSDEQGVRIGAEGPASDWQWHFTEQGAAFSGDGFSFRVRKP